MTSESEKQRITVCENEYSKGLKESLKKLARKCKMNLSAFVIKTLMERVEEDEKPKD